MYGHIRMFFKPGQVSDSLPALIELYAAAKSHRDKQVKFGEIKEALQESWLNEVTLADHLSGNNQVTLRNGRLVVQEKLVWDLDVMILTAEEAYCMHEMIRVQLACWVSARSRPAAEGLQCGRFVTRLVVKGLITNDPKGDDPQRMKIEMLAPDLGTARDVLLGILEGEVKPNKPWII